jgi:hypothetical protein
MRLGFICLNLPGHLNPMTALARQLEGRHHEVVFLYSSSANGLPCVPGDDRDPINENRSEVKQAARRGRFRICHRPTGTADRGDLKINARDDRGVWRRCPDHRPDPILCRTGADELGHPLHPRGGWRLMVTTPVTHPSVSTVIVTR